MCMRSVWLALLPIGCGVDRTEDESEGEGGALQFSSFRSVDGMKKHVVLEDGSLCRFP